MCTYAEVSVKASLSKQHSTFMCFSDKTWQGIDVLCVQIHGAIHSLSQKGIIKWDEELLCAMSSAVLLCRGAVMAH